jgi:hypothetical protein
MTGAMGIGFRRLHWRAGAISSTSGSSTARREPRSQPDYDALPARAVPNT